MGHGMDEADVLILPGLHDSSDDHWQHEWQRSFGFEKVDFGEWERPTLLGWVDRLEERVRTAPGRVILVAHSLGCLAAVWWAKQSRCTDAVVGALLVAPPDVDCCNCPAPLRDFRPVPTQRLPFRSIVVGSRNDPYSGFDVTKGLAQRWGSEFVDCGDSGHLNAKSGLGRWSEGVQLLLTLTPPDVPLPLTRRSSLV